MTNEDTLIAIPLAWLWWSGQWELANLDLHYLDRFRCIECGQLVHIDFGAADDQPDVCDDCWLDVPGRMIIYTERD
jgi:hypothetical protein